MPVARTWMNIPLVDFSACALTHPLSLETAEVKETVDQLVDSLERYSCLYITDHGLGTDEIAVVRQASAQFFELSKEIKIKCQRTPDDAQNGWMAEGIEDLSDPSANGDLRECFSIGLHDLNIFPWPDENVLPGFRTALSSLMRKLNLLARRLFKLLGTKYSPQDPTIFTRAHKNMESGANNFTCLRSHRHHTAPASGADTEPYGGHTDSGIFTFLINDQYGGFQTLDEKGQWFDVRPQDGAIFIYAGDMLARWTASKIKSMVHRVSPTKNAADPNLNELSASYLVQPDNDFQIRCLDGSDTYTAVTYLAYIRTKLCTIKEFD